MVVSAEEYRHKIFGVIPSPDHTTFYCETDMAAATASPEPKGTLTPPGSSPLRAECDPTRDSSHGSTPPSPEAPPTPDSAHMATEPTNHSAARFQPANDTKESRLLTNQEPLSGAKKRKAAKVHKVEMECGSEGEGDIGMSGSFNCPVCQEDLPDQHEFTQHIRKHNHVIETDNGTKVYCCGICQKQLSSNSSLDRHMLVHSGERPFRCHICGTHFTTNGNMHRHIRGHYRNSGGGSGVGTGSDTGESDLGSEEGVSSPRKRSLEDENTGSVKAVRLNTIEIEEEELTCPACGVEQPGQHALEQHVETIHPEYQVACNKCQVGFKNYRGLHLHNSMVHPMSSSSPPHLDLTLTDFSSPKFPLIAKEICENSSRMHDLPGEEGQGLHRCHLCHITFPCAEAWLMHMREHTATSASSPPFRCPRCVMRFSNLAEFAQHQQRHLCEEPQPPKESFLAVLDLLQNRDSGHANVASLLAGRLKPPLGMPPPGQYSPAPADSAKASPEHPTASRIASTTASSASASSALAATAAGISHDEQFAREYRDMKLNGQYPCRLCKDVFANLRKLKSHNLVHMLAPPYRCNLCTFYSNDKNTLKEHMKSHKGDTPYECNICNLAFTTKANCERHIKNIHGRQSRDEIKVCMTFIPQESSGSCDRSMETVCHICHIDCKARSVLRDHIRSSHPEGMTKPFSCKLCGGTFSSENDVMRHVIQQHPEAASGPTLETLVANRSSTENHHEHHDLTPVESLLNFSKLPMGVPLTTHQSPSTSLPVTFPHKPSAPAPLVPSRPPTPIMVACHTPSSSVLSPVEDDFPLDLSIGKREKDTEEETEVEDEEEVDVETGDIKTEQTEPEDLSKPRSEHVESEEKEIPSETVPESTTDVLKIPKPPFPLGAIYPQPLSLCPPFSSHQYHPLFMPPYGGLHPVHNFDPALLEEYQKELKRGLHLTSGGGLLSATNAFLPSSSPSFPLSALALAAAHRDPLRVPRPDLRTSESKSDDSMTDNHNSSKSGDDDVMHFTMRNSVLMKKPKQRRYRTERPWRCDLCDKGFTLRSNMERHMKQQHPDIWQQKPRGLNAQRQESTTPSVNAESAHTISDSVREQLIIKIEKESAEEKGKDGEHKEEEERELVIDDNPEVKIEDDEEEEEEDEDDEGEEDEYDDDEDEEEEEGERDDERNLEDCSADLASVHKLLSAASNQSFPCFGSEGEDENNGDNDSNSNTSSGEAKRSAYSSAPQKQKCPFCQRKFPWSSSLVRHIRTHTGQKPYLCPVCRFPFTTKSNCDRHLLRKHPDSPHTVGGDRPYRCCKCPGAAFTSLESLRKHEMFKHEKASDTAVSRDDSRPFRCHVCEVPLATRDVALQHLDENHPEHSANVVNAEPVTSDNNNDTISVAPDSTTTDRVSCMFCLQRCWSLAELKQHVNSQHTRASSPTDSSDDIPKDESLTSSSSEKTDIKEERKEESEGTDFISNLLGTRRAVVDHLLTSKSADDAAKLLGVR